MSSEDDAKPEPLPSIGQIIAVIGGLIAVAISGGYSIHFAINEARFPVGPFIQFLGSVFATWGR